MRSLPHFSVHDFLAQFNDLFLDYGGHKCAGGFSMEAHLLPQLKEQIANTVAVMEEQEQEEIVHIDAELPPEYLTPNLMEIVEVFEPYGESNPPLHFLIQGARVEQMQMLANTKKGASAHIKLQLAYGNYRWPALQWNGYDEISKVIDVQDEIDLVFKMDRNQWRNNETIQLSIVALQPHKTAIEKIMRLEEEPLLDKKG
jgi:single-stranded-DNA-specific exonuclease